MVYAVSATMEGTAREGGIDWQSSNLEVRDVSRIKKGEQAFQHYVEGARRRFGIE